MRLLIPFLMALGGCAPEPATIVGRASVIDGDTIEIRTERVVAGRMVHRAYREAGCSQGH